MRMVRFWAASIAIVVMSSAGCEDMFGDCECAQKEAATCGPASVYTGYTDDSGNAQADAILAVDVVREAIELAAFPLNIGANPPLIEGSYHPVVGEITKSVDARLVGTVIDSAGTCLSDQTPAGRLRYGEYGVDEGVDSVLTGRGSFFTSYQESAKGYYLFSGTKSGDNIVNVVGLVVYKENELGGSATAWEYSETNWTYAGESCDE